jgi:hypothetical protein
MQGEPILLLTESVTYTNCDSGQTCFNAGTYPYGSRDAAAENGIDDDGDDGGSNQRSGTSKRSREDEAVQGDEWTCSTCETSNDGMESQCANCGAYVPPAAVWGWDNAGFATSSVSGDSMDDVRVSSKERKKKKRGDDKADDGAAPNAKRVKRS